LRLFRGHRAFARRDRQGGVGIRTGSRLALLDAFDPNRRGMHKTDTIDYVYVVSFPVR
jgi:hypothetical protein